MNNWYTEYSAELHRREINEEMGRIRLEETAIQGRPYRPGWFGRAMHRLANWLITTGEDLHTRYHAPAQSDCSNPSKQSYAH